MSRSLHSWSIAAVAVLALQGCGQDQDHVFTVPAPTLDADCTGGIAIQSVRVRLAESLQTGSSACDACIPVDPPASDAEQLAEALLAAGDLCNPFKLRQSFLGVLVLSAFEDTDCTGSSMLACGFAGDVEIPMGRNVTLPRVVLHCGQEFLDNCR